MASLPCKLQDDNTLVIDDDLKISFRRTNKNENHNMAHPLPDLGVHRLHLPPSPSPFAEPHRSDLQGLFVQMKRELTAPLNHMRSLMRA
jgi:hypothetical protein